MRVKLLLIAFLLFCSSRAEAVIAPVAGQHTVCVFASGGTCALAGNTTATNLLTVTCQVGSTSTSVYTVSMTGESFSSVIRLAPSAQITSELFEAFNLVGSQTTVTVSATNASTNLTCFLDEWSGATTTDPKDKTVSASGFQTASSGNTATLTQANEMVLGMLVGATGNFKFTAGAGFTVLSTTCNAGSGCTATSSGQPSANEDEIVAATTAVACTFGNTATGTTNYAICATFLAGSGAAVVTPKRTMFGVGS